jgi:dTDP-L-rhamnose 4-epimerase
MEESMVGRVLVTGGAGFIGAHVTQQLLAAGHEVRVLDSLLDQVHGGTHRPQYLDDDVELVVGDIRDRGTVDRALAGVSRVVHLAARVGVGQSMYDVAEYLSVNTQGTGVLLEAIIARPVEKLVVASSMSIYGEGLCVDRAGTVRDPCPRSRQQLAARRWELVDSDGRELVPAPTAETKTPTLSSVYALGKYDQERLCLMIGEAYAIPTVALRFFNVYGPYQALSNPYTGVLAIFASRLLNDRRPLVFEDGEQRRDFVSVHDVARACALALAAPQADGHVINIGSGVSATVNEIAQRLARTLDKEHLQPDVTSKYRVGDVRHCFADIGRARELLGFAPEIPLDVGLEELAGWLQGQASTDRVDAATRELEARGLTV